MSTLALRSAGFAVPYAYKMARRYRQAAINRAGYAIGRRAGQFARARVTRAIRNRLKRKRTYKNTSSKAARSIGYKKGTGTTKRTVTQDVNLIARSTRTLYNTNVIEIPKTTTNEIDSRQRDIVFLKGVKLCFETRNLSAEPITFNIAYVSPKHDLDSPFTDDWFRGSGNTRSLNFDHTILNSNDFHCRPINTDKWNILMHKRFKLDPKDISTSITTTRHSSTRPSYMTFQKYLKINRQIRFNDDSSVQSRSKLHLVYWYDKFMAPTNQGPQGVIDAQYRTTCYFKESV